MRSRAIFTVLVRYSSTSSGSNVAATAAAAASRTKNIAKHEIVEGSEKLFRDFNYSLVRHSASQHKQGNERLSNLINREEDRPLVFVFGWAGASHKNLDKYAEIYRRAGCDTLAYFLPSRFIFSATAQVPHLARRLMSVADTEGLLDRPIFFHDLSDTGLMVYQGVQKVSREEGVPLDVRGHVMDSCPGPRPKATLPRTIVFGVVNWMCYVRDGMGLWPSAKETMRVVYTHAWPNHLRYRKGLKSELISSMDGLWSGEYAAQETAEQAKWPELFLYSKTDFYLPYEFLESEVLARRAEQKREFRTKRWEKSGHVEHLRAHKREYVDAVHSFIDEVYFSSLPAKADQAAGGEAEELKRAAAGN